MGLLFTTEGTRRVINTLNTAFDGPGKGLDVIRNSAASAPKLLKKVAKRNWKPGHLARMLSLFPYDQGDGAGKRGAIDNRHTKRWHFFLKTVVGSTDAVFVPLRDALADAILNQDSNGNALSIVRVAFDHVELGGPQDDPGIKIFDAPLPGTGGGVLRHITLFTVPVPKAEVGSDFDGNDSDEGDLPTPPWTQS